ncbi:peptidylprolyl isomerase [Citrifermentans bemidjiense]|nr:peptidylprolyl isomerase [Citrifermentans bemidjiense]
MREYYQANIAAYGGSEVYSARHIFFKVDKKGGAGELSKAETRANEVLAKARAGEDFAALAKKYSDDPAAAKDGGDLGTFKKADMLPEIGDTVSAMKPGEVSSIVRSPAGLHIIKLEGKKQDAGRPFEQVKDSIEDTLYKKKSDERFAQWVKELRAGAAIELR